MDSSSQRGCSEIIIILWPARNQWLKVQAYGCPKLKLQVCKNEIHKTNLAFDAASPFFPTKSYQHKGIYKNSRDLYTILMIPIQSDWPYHFSRPSTYNPPEQQGPGAPKHTLCVWESWKNRRTVGSHLQLPGFQTWNIRWGIRLTKASECPQNVHQTSEVDFDYSPGN